MDKEKKKRLVKILVGGAVCIALAIKSQLIIRERIKKNPDKDIAVQLSNTFWAICYILYNHYYVGERKE